MKVPVREEGICCTGWLVCTYIIILFSKELGKTFPKWVSTIDNKSSPFCLWSWCWGRFLGPGRCARCCQAGAARQVPTHCALLCCGNCQPWETWEWGQGNAWGRLSALLSTAGPCEAELSPGAHRKAFWGVTGEVDRGTDFSHAVLSCSGVWPQRFSPLAL